jgi:predicted glycogen debranching enzyme
MIEDIVRRVPIAPSGSAAVDSRLTREWLVTNGLGGYSSATIAGVITRRYHGLLVAALPNPLGRTVMLNHLMERITFSDGTDVQLGAEERAGTAFDERQLTHLSAFRLEGGLPVWEYSLGTHVLEKRVLMPHRQNTVFVLYRLLRGTDTARLDLCPAVHFRAYEAPVGAGARERYRFTIEEHHYQITGAEPIPPLRLMLYAGGVGFRTEERETGEVVYRLEGARGYEFTGSLWSPGSFEVDLAPDRPAALVASTEHPEVVAALTPEMAMLSERERRRRLVATAHPLLREGPAAELVLAADQFVIMPAGRIADSARAWAVGDEIRTIIAGYHWFTDWGRDTMIALEGLTLATGRHREAGAILRAFAYYMRDGLIPNMFPDGSDEGLYHTADATLWFFHAVDRFVTLTEHRATLRLLLPVLLQIFDHHVEGTRFGIGVDPADGLITQGAEGYQLTWMDAKVGDWVVTPRAGKAVEINALWYNALCLLERWIRDERGSDEARRIGALSARVRRSFNERFWYEDGGYLHDVVDGPTGDSIECRPNQLLAISLPNPVLDRERWARVLEVVQQRLVTPVGLRSLAPGSHNYASKYYGDIRARDAAYHQGTVWAWLVGPWIDAWLKAHPDDKAGARRYLDGLLDHLSEFGVGTIAEIFDAEPPYTPRGCIAQAWSVAEELRCLLKTS